MVSIGKAVSDFELPASGGKTVRMSSLKGKNVVVYFYPKDNTPGCTKEGEGFRDHYQSFQKMNTEILGVSRDSVKAHDNFSNKYGFPFALLSDPDEMLCKQFDVIKEKNMYGRKVIGIERSTFVIDAAGILVKEYRKVKVKGHVEEVLAYITELNAG